MAESKYIPWKRIAVEGAAIVASILLAFAIDARWSDFQRDEHLRLVLDRLAENFVENIALTSDNIDLATSGRTQLLKFIYFDPDETNAIPPDGGFSLISPIARPYTDISNNSIIISVLDREDLAPISSDGLIDAVNRWRGRVEQVQAKELQLEVIEQEALGELARHPQLAMIYGDLFENMDTDLDDKALISVRRDERVTAIAVKKSVFLITYIRHLEALREEAKYALSEIRALQPASQPDDAD